MKRRLFCKGRDQTLWLHCPFIKDAHDESGNNRAVNTSNVSFSAEGALTGRNKNSYIDTGYMIDTTAHDTSIVFRVKVLDKSTKLGYGFVMGTQNATSQNATSQNWPHYMWALVLNDDNNIQIYAYGNKLAEYNSYDLRTGFRKVAIVYTQQYSKLYIDDVLCATAEGSKDKSRASLSFGSRKVEGQGYMDQLSIQIRNLSIYDRELSISEIKSINV